MKIKRNDLNGQITALAAALASGELRNSLLLREALASNEVIQSAVAAVRLADEELAASGATVERIELAAKLEKYILTLGGFFVGVEQQAVPDYLKRGGTTSEIFERFFANVGSLNPKVLQYAEVDHGTTLALARQWHADWETAKERETLDEVAREKIHAALDLRAKLIGDLRYLGYTTAEISEILNPTEEIEAAAVAEPVAV